MKDVVINKVGLDDKMVEVRSMVNTVCDAIDLHKDGSDATLSVSYLLSYILSKSECSVPPYTVMKYIKLFIDDDGYEGPMTECEMVVLSNKLNDAGEIYFTHNSKEYGIYESDGFYRYDVSSVGGEEIDGGVFEGSAREAIEFAILK